MNEQEKQMIIKTIKYFKEYCKSRRKGNYKYYNACVDCPISGNGTCALVILEETCEEYQITY